MNLTTGATTSVGTLGFTNQVYSLAVAPLVPGPGDATLFAGAALLLGWGRRRR